MTWLIQNWRLALLMMAAAVFGYMRIEAKWLRTRLDRAQRENAALQADTEAHERMNDAEIGLDLSDADRVRKLHEFADKHSR